MNFLRETDKAKKASTEFLDPLKQGQETTPRIKRFGRYSVTIISASLLVSLVAVAGSLTPPGVPASTMRTLQEIYDTVVGPFDSSLITSDQDGSVIQSLKYISENLSWAVSGSDIYNTNSGNVGIMGGLGIGTTSPASPLEVVVSDSGGGGGDGVLISGDAGFSPAVLFASSPGGTLMGQVGTVMSADDFVLGSALDDMVIENTQTGNLLLGINDQEIVRITNAGNVGIGTTGPAKMLHVDGDVQFGGTGYGSLFPGFGRLFLRTDDGAGLQPFLLFQDLTYGTQGMGFSFVTDGTDAGTRMDTIDSAGNPIYTLTNSGNVGIGTTDPSTDFVLHRTDSATAVIESVATISEAYSDLSLVTDDGAHGFNIWTNNSLRSIGAGPLSANFSLDDDAPIAFFTNGSERLRIMGNGNVGIGTTAPVAQLETRGTTGLITYSGAPYSDFTADSQSYIDYGSNVFTSLNDSAVRGSGLMGGIQDDTMTQNIIGTYGWAESTNSVLSTKSVVALNGDAYNSGSGGVDSIRGLVTYTAQFGSGPVGSMAGVYIGRGDVSGGTVTDNVGLYINDQTGLGTNNYAIYSDVGPFVVEASGNVGIGTTAPETEFEVVGTASVSVLTVSALTASALTGAGLTDCDLESQTLNWDATTGTFSCLTDDTGTGGSAVGLREGFTGSFTNFSSISFNAAHFVLDTGNPDARLSLDWGSGGPASLSQNETVTGAWTFSTNPTFSGGGRLVTSNSLDFDEFENAMNLDANTTITGGAFALTLDHASVSGNFEVGGSSSASQTFGSGLTDCDAESQTLNWDATTGRFSCLVDASSGSGVASDSLDFDEFVDSMTLDANTTISNGGFRLTIQGASMSGNFDPTINDTFDLGEDLLRWRDIYLGPGSMHIGTSIADEYVVSYDTTSNFIGFNANGSGNPEVVFDSVGNVGIGTTTAGARLTVSGGATIGTTTASNPISLNSSSGSNTTSIGTGTTTGAITLGGNLNNVVIDSDTWNVSSTGAITGVTTLNTSGLVTLTGGLTSTVGTISMTTTGGNAINIGTGGAQIGPVNIGGNSNSVVIDDDNWDISGTGVITGATLTTTNLITASGGLTSTVGAVNLTTTGGSAINIGTGTLSTPGPVTIGGGASSVAINSDTWDITSTGTVTGVTLNLSSLLTLSGGLTSTVSPVSITTTGGNAINIGTGTTGTPGPVNLGGGANSVVINSDTWDISGTGVITGATLTTSNLITASGGITATVGPLSFTTTGGNSINIGTGTQTGPVNIGNSLNSLAISTSTWDMSASGTLTGVTLNLSSLLTLSGGLTSTVGAVSITTTGGNAINLGTGGAQTGPVNIGGNSNSVVIDSDTWNVSGAGVITGATLTTTNLITASGGITATVGPISMTTTGGNAINIGTGGAQTGAVNIGGNSNNVVIDSDTWNVSGAGAITGVTTLNTSGLITATGGITSTLGAVSLTTGVTGNTISIGTGTQTGAVTIGGGSNTVAIDSSDWDISTTGLFTGVSGVNSTGAEVLTLNNTATGNIEMAGGVGATGCTLTNTTGDFSCSGNITTTLTGTPTAGFWTRNTTLGHLYPSTLSDNIGIGDSSPVAQLVVGSGDLFQVNSLGRVQASPGASGAGTLSYSFVGDTDTGLWHSAGDQMSFRTSGADALTIDPAGNVGIATTTAIGHKLKVMGKIFAAVQATAVDEVVTAGRLVSAGTGMSGGGALTGDITLSSTTWSASSGGNIFNLNAGNVGIGEDTPGSKLQVNGNTALGYAGPTAGPADGLTVSGNVGIGTTTAAEKLAVTGNVTVTGNITALGTITADVLLGSCNIDITVSGSTSTDVPDEGGGDHDHTFTDTGSDGECADYAELYHSSEPVYPGDLVAFDPMDPDPSHVKKATIANAHNIMGIVSTHPAAIIGNDLFVAGKMASEYHNENEPAVALVGRVPLKVSLENGPISMGDRLTASSVPGVAMKATEPGITVGVAMWTPETNASGQTTVLTFVNVGYWAPDVESLVSDTSLGIQITPTSILSYVLDYLGDAILEVKKLVAGTVKTKNFEIEDSATGEIYCVRIVNGEWDKQEGECSSAPAQNSSPSETPAEDPDTDTDPTAQGGEPLTESPSADESEETSESTPEPESETDPESEPESESASEPETESTSTTE